VSDDLEYEVEFEKHEPKPLDGIELRDALAGDYRRGYWRNSNTLITRNDAETMAADDCRMTDRYESERRGTYTPTPQAAEPKLDAAHAEAEKVGARLVKATAKDDLPPRMPDPVSVMAADKVAALTHRILILCGESDGQPHYPHYAELIQEEYINCGLGRRQYRFCVTPTQRARIYARRLEDIAEKSNSHPHLPNWWVK
jgi:hypothetical protein